MADETAIIVGVLVSIVVVVLCFVIAGFWIYLCCGQHRDLVWKRYEPDPIYPSRPLRVTVSAGVVSIDSVLGSTNDLNHDQVSLQPSIAPITRKPTVRKQKLFTSQPDLAVHRNMSQSIGRLMESEPASHYQLSIDETDELLVDQGMFELQPDLNLEEYDAEPRNFGGDQAEGNAGAEIETDQQTPFVKEQTEVLYSSSPDILDDTERTENLRELKTQIEELEPMWTSSPTMVASVHGESVPSDHGVQIMQSESRDADLDQDSSSKESSECVKENVLENQVENEAVTGNNDTNNNLRNTSDDEDDRATENKVSKAAVPLESDVQVSMTEGSGTTVEESGDGKEEKDKAVEKASTTSTEEETESGELRKDEKEEIEGNIERMASATHQANGGEPSENFTNESQSEDDREHVGKQVEEEGKSEKNSEGKSEESIERISSETANLQEKVRPEVLFRASLSNASTKSLPLMKDQEDLSNVKNQTKDEDSLIETASLSKVSELREKFLKIETSRSSSPTITTKEAYDPLKYPKQNVLKSGFDVSGSESSLSDSEGPRDISSHENNDSRNELNGVLKAGPPNLNLSESEPKRSISSLATVTYKADSMAVSSVTSISDTESDTMMTSSVQTPETKQAVIIQNPSTHLVGDDETEGIDHVKESTDDYVDDNRFIHSEASVPKHPPRKRKVTPAVHHYDHSKFKIVQQQLIVEMNTAKSQDTTQLSLGSIPEERGFREEDEEEELESQGNSDEEGHTKF